MLKLPIEYTDFNGVTVTETFYFNLSTAEVAEMELTMAGGLVENLKRIGESGNPELIMKTFKAILLQSFGVRSEDGRLFRKDDAFVKDFVSSGAYEVLYVRLVTDSQYAAEFVEGIMPKNEDANAQHLIKAAQDRKDAQGAESRPLPQAVVQQAERAVQTVPVGFDQYVWLSGQLIAQGVDHNFIEEQFFINLPAEQQSSLIKDLQGKLPQSGG